MMRNKPRCVVKCSNEKNSCSREIVIEIKVTLFHPSSERKSNQKWHFCEEHLFKFLGTKGIGWYRWYNKSNSISPVIDYEIISCSEYISMNSLSKINQLAETDKLIDMNLLEIM